MPHSEECIELRPADGWCAGHGCTITEEDYPELWKAMFGEKHGTSQGK